MRILHLINTLDLGGAQFVLKNLIEHWPSGEDQHQVISLLKHGTLSDAFTASGIPVQHMDFEPGKFEIAKFFRLIGTIREAQPDIVQTWLYHSDLIGGLAARLASKAPVVWGIHHTTASPTSVKSSTWQTVRLLAFLSRNLPTKIICCSNSAYTSHLKLGYPIDKMTTIYNGVDTERFVPDANAKITLRKALGVPSTARLIGMFARYNPQKDHTNFIQAAAILAQSHPDVHFVLAGENIDQNNTTLTTEIQRANLSDRIHLLGKSGDMPTLCAGVDIVSLSSSYGEALPMTLCEGMACGTVCVATDVGDVSNIIGDTGIVVPPKDPAALADGWQSILKYTDKGYHQLSDQARKRIIDKYSLKGMTTRYLRAYQETVTKNAD